MIRREGSGFLVEAPGAPVEVASWLFDPGEIQDRGLLAGTSTGRRTAWFLEHGGVAMVLRHYWRGGLIARFNDDLFLWSGLRRSRPFRELGLLGELRKRGLPVPRPVGARVTRKGPVYRGDLLTVAIPGTRTLAEAIRTNELTGAEWVETGRTIRRFHDAGAFHADLNVRNILLDDRGRVWLIDWDRGRRRSPGGRWTHRTLARLHRSLEKEPEIREESQKHWPTLLRAYEAARP